MKRVWDAVRRSAQRTAYPWCGQAVRQLDPEPYEHLVLLPTAPWPRARKLHLQQVGSLDRAIVTIEAEAGEALRPCRTAAYLLTTIPGVKHVAARVVVAEIGVDMTRFPTGGHLISWAGLCPNNDESAGKRRSTHLRKRRTPTTPGGSAVTWN